MARMREQTIKIVFILGSIAALIFFLVFNLFVKVSSHHIATKFQMPGSYSLFLPPGKYYLWRFLKWKNIVMESDYSGQNLQLSAQGKPFVWSLEPVSREYADTEKEAKIFGSFVLEKQTKIIIQDNSNKNYILAVVLEQMQFEDLGSNLSFEGIGDPEIQSNRLRSEDQ